MSDCRMSFDTGGIEKMIGTLNKMNVSPQKAVNKGTSKAIQVVKRAVRTDVPVKSGTLKKNIVIRAEKTHGVRGKRWRQVTYKGGEEANALLQKPIQHPGALGGKNPKAYYPASMEYGFLARAKGGGVVYYDRGVFRTAKTATEKQSWTAKSAETRQAVETKKVAGKHFMRDAAERVSDQAKSIMIDVTMDELEKIWQEANYQ